MGPVGSKFESFWIQFMPVFRNRIISSALDTVYINKSVSIFKLNA
jgi:hypothetical protein